MVFSGWHGWHISTYYYRHYYSRLVLTVRAICDVPDQETGKENNWKAEKLPSHEKKPRFKRISGYEVVGDVLNERDDEEIIEM